MARIRGNNATLQPTLQDGVTPNPLFNEIVYLKIRGYRFENKNNGFAIKRIDDFKDFDIDRVVKFVENGAKVENYPAWVRLNETKYQTEDVPEFMPNRQDGEATVYKWEQWFNDNNTPTITQNQQGDNIYWVQTSASDNKYVDGDTIKALIDAGYTVKSQHQMQNIIENNE